MSSMIHVSGCVMGSISAFLLWISYRLSKAPVLPALETGRTEENHDDSDRDAIFAASFNPVIHILYLHIYTLLFHVSILNIHYLNSC